jgi:hypothetical protein
MKRTDPSQDQGDVGQDDLRQCPHHPVDPRSIRWICYYDINERIDTMTIKNQIAYEML